jgi:hypothetical protein
LNNNRNSNNNNRRRGRGNRQQNGGGQQLNRIDSRARGNAPQLLEKYRKLAHDAHLNGDRVQAEYYLQFADHYFRVLADQRTRQDEQRARREDRWEGGNEPERDADENEFESAGDFPTFDQVPNYNRAPRQQQDDRTREERREREPREAAEPRGEEEASRDTPGDEAEGTFDGNDNPFLRPNRNTRGLRPRRDDRRPARGERGDDEDAPGIDPGILPPPIALSPAEAASDDEPPAPKRPRGRPRKVRPEDGAGEALESVN